MQNKIEYSEQIDNYFSSSDELKSKWNTLDEFTKEIVLLYIKETNGIEFLLDVDDLIRKTKFNNKLEGILND